MITLSPSQNKAYTDFATFLSDPKEAVFVLAGYSGTGKSTLVKYILDQLNGLLHINKLINPKYPEYEVHITATTNKAAESLANIIKKSVSTIHSLLRLRVGRDNKGRTTLYCARPKELVENALIFIDEASYIDSDLLTLISQKTKNCKLVFIGDPAQLTPVNSNTTPVFNLTSCKKTEMTDVVRQAEGNPIIELSTCFRNTVNTGDFFSFTPDNKHIQWLEREDFEDKILEEFSRKDWNHADSKVLVWTNKAAINYNHGIRENLIGIHEFQEGDYAICNSFIAIDGFKVSTDEMVLISKVIGPSKSYDVDGTLFEINGSFTVFSPNSIEEKNLAIKKARKLEQYDRVAHMEDGWIDLRAVYACTVNKAQGSTYKKVFIDLDDIKKCKNPNLLARLLYVAVSRAKETVYLTGDLV